MKLTDFVVEFLSIQGVKEFFGYQGTMVAHLVDSIGKNSKVQNCSCYNEQGAAFAACGLAKATGELAVAYSTSGPGAINLLSGVAESYFDSVPVLFITGQINTYEYANNSKLRQQGYQEVNIVSMAESITKYCVQVRDPARILYELEKAIYLATTGRKGAVLIDLPMDMQRADIDINKLARYIPDFKNTVKMNNDIFLEFSNLLSDSKRPLLSIGAGVTDSKSIAEIVEISEKMNIPIVTSLLGRSLLPTDYKLNLGYVGYGYGHRSANLVASVKADLIICLGNRLSVRQVGRFADQFATDAKIFRLDIDENELARDFHKGEKKYLLDANQFIHFWHHQIDEMDCDFSEWADLCMKIKKETGNYDDGCKEQIVNRFIKSISQKSNDYHYVVCDVGQHQMWIAQSFKSDCKQKMLFSGGHGAMGFALPASIGVAAGIKEKVLCLAGDGAMMMNIQELQWVQREKLPILIIVLNNSSLGMIKQFQDEFMDECHYGTTGEYGFSSPSFSKLAEAFGINTAYANTTVEALEILDSEIVDLPMLLEVNLADVTIAFPKTFYGEKMYNQRPYLPQVLLKELLEL